MDGSRSRPTFESFPIWLCYIAKIAKTGFVIIIFVESKGRDWFMKTRPRENFRECSQIYLHFKICRDATFTVVEKSSKLVGIITEFSGNNNRDIHYYEKQCREINVYSFQNTTLYKTIVRIVWTVYPFTKKLSRPRFKIWKFYETLYPFFLLISIYI